MYYSRNKKFVNASINLISTSKIIKYLLGSSYYLNETIWKLILSENDVWKFS